MYFRQYFFYLLFNLLAGFTHATEPFVLFPSAFFWNSTNFVHVTPLLKTHEYIDIALTVEEEDGANLRKTVFNSKQSRRPTMETSTFQVHLPENSLARRYYVTVALVGQTEFHAHVNGASNVATIFLQTDKVFYKPEETISIRALPITPAGDLYLGNVEFQLLDPNGFRIFNKTATIRPESGGFIETNFDLPSHVRFGEWRVVASAENSFRKAEISIRVREYALPKYHVFLTVTESDESPFIISTTVLAKFANGMRLDGDVFLGCEMLSGSAGDSVATTTADTPAPLRRKLGKGELRDGEWTGRLNVTECAQAAGGGPAGSRHHNHHHPPPQYHRSGLTSPSGRGGGGVTAQPSTRLLVTAEVHERGTFLANVAAVEYDPLAAGFEIVPLRPAYTQYQRAVTVYLRPTGGRATAAARRAIELVAQCVSADTAANGLNHSLGDQRLGTAVEVPVDLRCTVLLIKGRTKYVDSSTTVGGRRAVAYYSREERVVIPSLFRSEFLRFHLIRIEDMVRSGSGGTQKVEFYDGETVRAVVPPDRGLNYFVICNSRDVIVAAAVLSGGRITVPVTAATMHGACVLYVYGMDGRTPFADMSLFFVAQSAHCANTYSVEASKQNTSVFDEVELRLHAPAGSLASLHAYDSRLEALLAQARRRAAAAARGDGGTAAALAESLARLWTFAEFMSPVLRSDFAFPANLLPMDQLNRHLRAVCAMAGRQTPQCTTQNPDPPSASFVSDVCTREIVRACNEQESVIPEGPSGLQDRQMHAQVEIAGYVGNKIRDHHVENLRAPPVATVDSMADELAASRSGKVASSTDQAAALRDFFPEVWLFNSYTIGPTGMTTIRTRMPHSVTRWQLRAQFWTRGQQEVCEAPPSELYALKSVFMDVDVPLHVYENETVQVRVTVTAADVTASPMALAVCFGGLSPAVCGDVGRNGTLGETDYTRVVLSADQRVQVKKFYVRFLRAGHHNLTFELREENALPGGDWHCRDDEARLYDRISRQVHVDERVDLEEHFRQVIVYQAKRILPQESSGAEVALAGAAGGNGGTSRVMRMSAPDLIQYSQSHLSPQDVLLTDIHINSVEKVYSMQLEFAKFEPSLPPSLATALYNAPASGSQLSPLQSAPQLDSDYFVRRRSGGGSANRREKWAKKRYRNVYRDRRSIFDSFLGGSGKAPSSATFSLPTVLRNLAAATYELKPLDDYRVVLADEIEKRKYVIGDMLSELLTYSDCVGIDDETCGFGEFGRPRHPRQRNILLSTLATSLLCEQSASPEFVCGPSRFLADVARQLNASSYRAEIDLGFSTQLRFNTFQEKALFMQCLLVRMVLDCGMYQCIAEKSAWQNLHREFFSFNERDVRDMRLEAALAYVSTPSTRQMMRIRLSGKGNVERLPFWSMTNNRDPAANLLENNILKSENILTNSLALLAYSTSRQLYDYWRNQFDFDALAGWLVEQQSAGGLYENAIDTYFGCRALYSYRVTQMPTGFEARKIYANLTADTVANQRQFTNRELPFSLSIPPSTRHVTLSTRGDGRLLVGLRVLSGRRRRSKRDPSDNYPVSIRMTQFRHAATNFINQTVTLFAHSAMLKYLEVEHGIFTGFTTQPSLVVIQSDRARFYYEPRVSSTAVHFVIENFRKDEPITYTVLLTEPEDSYSPDDLAPIAISAIHHTVVGRLIVLPTSVSFTTTDTDPGAVISLLSDDAENGASRTAVVAHPPHQYVHFPVHNLFKGRRRNFDEGGEIKPRRRRDLTTLSYFPHHHRRHRRHLAQRRAAATGPQSPQFHDGPTSGLGGGASIDPPHYNLGSSVRVRKAGDAPLLVHDQDAGLAAANLQSSTDELVETVCLANGACTCAEMTCQMQCANCSALTFDSLCAELHRASRFSVIFRILDRHVAEVGRALYTVFDVRILDWFSRIDAPEELSIWIRDCNPQCLQLTETVASAKPRFLLIGDARGLLSEGADVAAEASSWDESAEFSGGLSSPGGEGRKRRRASEPTAATAATGSRWRRMRDSLLRHHYVVRDNDRLARSTDCWPLFGRLQDEQCSASRDEL